MTAGSTAVQRGLAHVVQQAGWGLSATVVGLLVRYGLILAVARSYGAHVLGVYSLTVGVGVLASMAATLGLDSVLLRFVPFHTARGEEAERRTLERLSVWPVLINSVLFGAMVGVLSSSLALIFHDSLLRHSLRLVAIAVPAMALGLLFRAQLRTSEDVRLASVLEQVAIPAVNLAVVVGFSAVAHEAWPYAPVLGYVTGQLFATLGARLALGRSSSASGPRSVAWKQWLGYGVPMWFDAFVLLLLGYVDQFLLGHLTSTKEVGLYAPAVRLAGLVALPILAVNAVLAPMIARLDGTGARDDLQRLYGRVNWGVAFAGFTAGIGCLVLGEPLLRLFGHGFQSSYPAFAVLVGGQIVATASGCAGTLLTMTGWSKLRLANALAALVLNAAVDILLIPRYGLVGAAAGTSVSLAAINLLQVVEVRRLLRLTTFERSGLAFWLAQVHRMPRG